MRRSAHATSLLALSNRRLHDTLRTRNRFRRHVASAAARPWCQERVFDWFVSRVLGRWSLEFLPDHIMIVSYRRLPRSRRCRNGRGGCGRCPFCCRSLRNREVDGNRSGQETRRRNNGELCHPLASFDRCSYDQSPGRQGRPTARHTGSRGDVSCHFGTPSDVLMGQDDKRNGRRHVPDTIVHRKMKRSVVTRLRVPKGSFTQCRFFYIFLRGGSLRPLTSSYDSESLGRLCFPRSMAKGATICIIFSKYRSRSIPDIRKLQNPT